VEPHRGRRWCLRLRRALIGASTYRVLPTPACPLLHPRVAFTYDATVFVASLLAARDDQDIIPRDFRDSRSKSRESSSRGYISGERAPPLLSLARKAHHHRSFYLRSLLIKLLLNPSANRALLSREVRTKRGKRARARAHGRGLLYYNFTATLHHSRHVCVVTPT